MSNEPLTEAYSQRLRLAAYVLEEALRRTEEALRTQRMNVDERDAVLAAADQLSILLGS